MSDVFSLVRNATICAAFPIPKDGFLAPRYGNDFAGHFKTSQFSPATWPGSGKKNHIVDELCSGKILMKTATV
jgi:hypothetical protein